MKKIKSIFIAVLSFSFLFHIGIISNAETVHLYLFGGKDYIVFLGCLTSDKYDENSIWNKYSEYGSKYNSLSIWNKYGTYGSQHSEYSP